MNHRREAISSADYWEFQPGEHVMTIDGFPGVVDEVQDGPIGGAENYIVTLDHGLGGGNYSASMLAPLRRTAAEVTAQGIHLASEDYPELGTILEDRPDPGKMVFTAAAPGEQADGLPQDSEQPSACSYCGGTEFKDPTDNGRVRQATCATCDGTMSAHPGMQWTPELIGDPSNHPKPTVDPRSGASGAGGQAGINDFIDFDSRVSTTAAEHQKTARDWTFDHHEEQTGGTKFPVKHKLHAQDPDSRMSGGHVDYFPPKRRGGPVHIDNLSPSLNAPGAGSAMMNEIQGRHPDSTIKFLHEQQRDKNAPSHTNSAHGEPTNWDIWHKGVQDDGIHRGFAMRMEPHHARTLNDPSSSKDDHLQALHEAMPEGPKMGMHWTTDRQRAQSFAHSGVMDPRTDIPVVLHAKAPERKDIETRPDQLFRNGVFPYDHVSREREVPVRRGRQVEVTGMSWKPDAEHPDADRNGWVHHTYAEDETKRHTAALAGHDWCTWRREAHCTFPGDSTAVSLAIPQDRGPCPWETSWQQQVCPIAEPGPMALMQAKGSISLPLQVASSGTTAALEARMAADDDDNYRLQHTAPDADYGAPLHDVTGHMHDFYEHPEYFHGGLPHDRESARKILDARDQPEKMIHVYRALPAEHAHKGIRPGDWVSTSKDYARNEGRTTSNSKDDYPVIRARVPAKHLHTEGDVNEWGYNGPDTVHGMVVYKGGHNQEVRHDPQGEIKQVQRRPKKDAPPKTGMQAAMMRLASAMSDALGPGSANR